MKITQKNKICFIVAVPITATNFLMDHMQLLNKYYEVHVVANFPDKDSKSPFHENNIICHDVPIVRKINLLDDIKGMLFLYRLFRKEKFACVHSVTPKAGLLTALAGWMARVPNRIHIFTGQVWSTRKGGMRFMLKSFDKLIALLDTKILTDGEGQRQYLIQNGIITEENSTVLADGSIAGIKLNRYIISKEIRQEQRSLLGLTDENIVYIFLGRLNHDKGIGELFDAFNHLVKECPKSVLLFYGWDEEDYDKKADQYENIKRGKNYLYPGITKLPSRVLQSGDVFVLPTWREGFGVSVLEAQALGLPVITSDTYGVVDASVEGVTGLRCHVNDPEGLYQCMKMYYENPELRKSHGIAGRKRVEEKFNYAIVSQAWLKMYQEML